MKDKIEVSFITTLPKIANSPKISIFGQSKTRYNIKCYEVVQTSASRDSVANLICDGYCNNNESFTTNARQWYTKWFIQIFDGDGKHVLNKYFELANQTVFIKIDAFALGDTIAWIPYVEEFRKKHGCHVICSTFHNDILVRAYPQIMFVAPNTTIHNVYAQYYIGATNDEYSCYSPIKVDENPLQIVAAAILGLERKEIRPNLKTQIEHLPSTIEGKYVCISEFGSREDKQWKAVNGWQTVVDKLNENGYKVMVISKESTTLTGIINKTGNINLFERMIDLMHADFFIGISSGLSWLSWAMNTHTVMISDVTPNFHEFQSDISRVNSNDLSAVNYMAENESSIENVLKKLGELGVS